MTSTLKKSWPPFDCWGWDGMREEIGITFSGCRPISRGSPCKIFPYAPFQRTNMHPKYGVRTPLMQMAYHQHASDEHILLSVFHYILSSFHWKCSLISFPVISVYTMFVMRSITLTSLYVTQVYVQVPTKVFRSPNFQESIITGQSMLAVLNWRAWLTLPCTTSTLYSSMPGCAFSLQWNSDFLWFQRSENFCGHLQNLVHISYT